MTEDYVTVYFQAVKNQPATGAGVSQLALSTVTSVFALGSSSMHHLANDTLTANALPQLEQ